MTLLGELRTWERLTRGRTAVAAMWVLIASAWRARGAWWTEDLTLLVLSIACTVVFAQVINDITDVAVDRRACRADRPLAEGAVNLAQAKACCALAAIASLVLAGLLGAVYLLVDLALLAASALYSLCLRRVIWCASVVVSACAASPVLLGAMARSSRSSADWLLFLSLFCYMSAFELIKDMRDVEADRAEGYLSAPVVFGPRRSARLVVLWCLLTFAAVVGLIHAERNSVAFAVVFLATAGSSMILSCMISLQEDANGALRWMRISWTAGLLSLAVLV